MYLFRLIFLGNRTAWQSFLILFISILLLFAASLSVFSMYLLYGRHPLSARRLVDETIKVIIIARSLPVDHLAKIRILSTPGLHVTMSPQRATNSVVIEHVTPKIVAEYVARHSYDFWLSIRLVNGQWLNIHGVRAHSYWISLGALLLGIVLLFALAAVCIWAIHRMIWSWDNLIKAVRRFGMDVDAPPMAEAGPRELRVVIRAFNEMQARIRRLLRDRTQMLAAISHDLRTPITRLQLRAEYLDNTDQYEKTVADLKEMESMIASILAFAREQNSQEAMERFDLNALLAALCHDMQDFGKPLGYRCKSKTERMPFFGRISALKRAFSNLLDNAIKYGQKAQVTLKSSRPDEVQIIIEDEGPGIPEAKMESVFAPFYRLDTSRSLTQAGTGLGMTVARDIIRAHGGDIKLYNRMHKGLRVVVSLPLRFPYKS